MLYHVTLVAPKQNTMKKILLIIATLFLPLTALAWNGIEPATGTRIDITSKRNKIKKGNTIEIFDYGKNEYHDVEIDRISSSGRDVKFEVYDKDIGEERVFIMESLSK